MRRKKMEKNLEVNIAFRIWNQLNQLESILWDRYRDEFLSLTIEQDDKDLSQDDSQDINDQF
jgi:DNA polymerase IIIc chi subunit